MPNTERNLLDYMVVCISEFASHYKIHMREAYLYLQQNKGLDFLREFYDVEHTLSFDDVIEDLTAICKKNGGVLN